LLLLKSIAKVGLDPVGCDEDIGEYAWPVTSRFPEITNGPAEEEKGPPTLPKITLVPSSFLKYIF
jgi:hypothetical protein